VLDLQAAIHHHFQRNCSKDRSPEFFMKEVFTKSFWQGVKKTFHKALEDPPPAAPNYVGLYQFNVVVPALADSDLVPLTFNLGGVLGSARVRFQIETSKPGRGGRKLEVPNWNLKLGRSSIPAVCLYPGRCGDVRFGFAQQGRG